MRVLETKAKSESYSSLTSKLVPIEHEADTLAIVFYRLNLTFSKYCIITHLDFLAFEPLNCNTLRAVMFSPYQ